MNDGLAVGQEKNPMMNDGLHPCTRSGKTAILSILIHPLDLFALQNQALFGPLPLIIVHLNIDFPANVLKNYSCQHERSKFIDIKWSMDLVPWLMSGNDCILFSLLVPYAVKGSKNFSWLLQYLPSDNFITCLQTSSMWKPFFHPEFYIFWAFVCWKNLSDEQKFPKVSAFI